MEFTHHNQMVYIGGDMLKAFAGEEAFAKFMAAPKLDTMSDLPITPRENVKLMLDHKVPKYLPMAGDINAILPGVIYEQSLNNRDGYDWFGSYWTYEPSAGARMVKPGTEILESLDGWKDKITFPDLDAIDWADSAEKMKMYHDPNRFSECWSPIGLFERLHSTIGMQNALIALLDDEDQVAEFFEAITEHKIKLIKKITQHYQVDAIFFHDDWGSKQNGFFSPEVFKKLILPNMKKIVQATHDAGAYFDLHSDGKVDMFIPYMVDIGVDIWHPAEVANDIYYLKREYGDRISFNGAMDDNFTLTGDADEEKLRSLVRERVSVMGKGGGYFASPATFNLKNKDIMMDELNKMRRTFYNDPQNR